MSDERVNFAKRLNAALDRIGFPPKQQGRQTSLARVMGVSQKGSRKWLEAEAMPTTSKIPTLARLCGVRTEWLLTGRGDMVGPDSESAASMVCRHGWSSARLASAAFALAAAARSAGPARVELCLRLLLEGQEQDGDRDGGLRELIFTRAEAEDGGGYSVDSLAREEQSG